jgi:hypothetical protein
MKQIATVNSEMQNTQLSDINTEAQTIQQLT